MAEIITVGEILVELMASRVGQRFDATGEFVGPFPSGAPAIFIDQAAKCGSKSMIISAVGNDGFGKMNLERLRRNGVDISRIKVLDDQTTGVAFVTYKEDGDRDFIFYIANAACGTIGADDLREEDFTDCNYFHVMGSSVYNEGLYAAILKGIDLTRKHGGKVSFDPNVRKEIINDQEKRNQLIDILYRSQIILAGENELYYLTGTNDERKSVDDLLHRGAEIVIIKRGSRGASLYTRQRTMDVEPYKVEQVDPTGAGDCFAGTFISCINQGMDLTEAIHFASIAGALAVTKKGPMEGNATLKELHKGLEELHKG